MKLSGRNAIITGGNQDSDSKIIKISIKSVNIHNAKKILNCVAKGYDYSNFTVKK
jgi:hypothetical protein